MQDSSGPTGMFPPIPPHLDGLQITSQHHTMAPGPDGKFVDGVEVGFVTRHGDTGKVFVPRTRYTAQNVRDEIVKFAHEMHWARTSIAPIPDGPAPLPGARQPL